VSIEYRGGPRDQTKIKELFGVGRVNGKKRRHGEVYLTSYYFSGKTSQGDLIGKLKHEEEKKHKCHINHQLAKGGEV